MGAEASQACCPCYSNPQHSILPAVMDSFLNLGAPMTPSFLRLFLLGIFPPENPLILPVCKKTMPFLRHSWSFLILCLLNLFSQREKHSKVHTNKGPGVCDASSSQGCPPPELCPEFACWYYSILLCTVPL